MANARRSTGTAIGIGAVAAAVVAGVAVAVTRKPKVTTGTTGTPPGGGTPADLQIVAVTIGVG